MTDASERLWWLNSVYLSRLSHADDCLSLLESLLFNRAAHIDGDLTALMGLLQTLHIQLIRLAEEHRTWRYTYYYQSPGHKRMVVDEQAVHRALFHFRRMRARHERLLAETLSLFANQPHPGSGLTRVVLGDLWLHAEHALDDLAQFMDAAADF